METTRLLTELKKEPSQRRYILGVLLLLLALFIWSLSVMKLQPLSKEGIAIAQHIFKGIFQPDVRFLLAMDDSGVIYLLLETIAIAVLGTLAGSILAVPLALLSAKNLVPRPFSSIAQVLILMIRTVPAFVYGLIFIRVTGPGASAGVLTLGLLSIGMVSKMFIETIEDLDVGILESMDAAGSTLFQKIRFGIIPQLRADFLSILLYRFDMNLRDAATLGLVGAGGIGAPLIFAMNAYKWSQVGSLLIGLFFLIFLVEQVSARIRAYLLKGE